MDMVGDLEEEVGDSVSEELPLPGRILDWEEEVYQDVVTAWGELQKCLHRRIILLMPHLGLRLIMEKRLIREPGHMIMLGRRWAQVPMLHR